MTDVYARIEAARSVCDVCAWRDPNSGDMVVRVKTVLEALTAKPRPCGCALCAVANPEQKAIIDALSSGIPASPREDS